MERKFVIFYLWEFHQNHLCLLNIDPRYQIEKKKLPIWRKNTSKIEKNISRKSSQIQMKMLIVHTIKSKLRAYNLSLRAGREDELRHHGKVSNEHGKLPLATWPHPQLMTRSLGLDTAPTKKSFKLQISCCQTTNWTWSWPHLINSLLSTVSYVLMSEKPEHTSTLTLIRTLVSKHYFQLTSFLNWAKITVALIVGHVDQEFSPTFFSRHYIN